MKTPIYLVVGVPGSGKSWVCEQLREHFEYIHHDGFIFLKRPGAYLEAIFRALTTAKKPLLIEAPFSVSETKDPLEAAGHEVVPLFIIEAPHVVSARYQQREGKPIPKGHLTRMETYARRSREWRAFSGTSEQVLKHLKEISHG